MPNNSLPIQNKNIHLKLGEIKKYIFLFLLTVIALNYFYATFLPDAFKALRILCLAICVIWGTFYLNSYKGEFSLPVKLLSLSMIFSILISSLSWEQPIYLGVLITIPFLLWPIYFLMFKLKISITLIENIILLFGLLYVILYFYQYLNPSKILFASNSVSTKDGEFVESRGIIRIIFPGVGIFWLAVYLALAKLTHENKHKIFMIIFALLGLIIPIMQVTRSFILPTLLVFGYHILKNTNLSKKIVLGVFAIISIPFIIDLFNPMIEGMLDAQKGNLEEGSKYVRLLAAKYFLINFPPSPLNYIFGNGMGHERAIYGQYLRGLMEKGFFISDIGIIGVYTYFGLFFIIGWILVYFKVYTLKINSRYIYVKYYFVNVFVGAITGSSLYHPGSLISSIFAIYIFQKYLKEERIKKLKSLLFKYLHDKEEKSKVKINDIN